MNVTATLNPPTPFKREDLPAVKATMVKQMGGAQDDARPIRMARRVDDHALFVYARNAQTQSASPQNLIDEFV